MNRLNKNIVLTGLGAGVTSALLGFGGGVQSSLSFFLYGASAMPVLIAGLGWGTTAALIALVSSFAVGSMLVSVKFAFAMALFTTIPAGWISHLANLARPASEIGGPEDQLAWYPLPDIMAQLCAMVAVGVIILGVMIGFGPALVDHMVDAMAKSFATQPQSIIFDEAVLTQTRKTMLIMLPMVQSAMWLILLFAAYYFAARIVSISGRAVRPREDMPSSLRMHRNTIFVMLAGVVMMFFGGIAAMIGAVLVGAFGAGFMIAGFASLHYRTRGKDFRVPLLILAYLSATLALPALVILAIGLSDTRRAFALTPFRDSNTNHPKTQDN